jgi:hypothetical protein
MSRTRRDRRHSQSLSTTFELVISLKTAKSLGLTIAPALPARGNQILR